MNGGMDPVDQMVDTVDQQMYGRGPCTGLKGPFMSWVQVNGRTILQRRKWRDSPMSRQQRSLYPWRSLQPSEDEAPPCLEAQLGSSYRRCSEHASVLPLPPRCTGLAPRQGQTWFQSSVHVTCDIELADSSTVHR